MDGISIETLKKEKDAKEYFYHDKCDKYDYLIAVGCGAVAGLIDIFLVGSPGDSKLLSWTDEQVDKVVMQFAKISGWTPKAGKKGNVHSAIAFLENKYRVNYDQRHTSDVGGAFKMSTKNHHLKSLAHSPDIIGLFFSILNQFTSTATFVSGGKLITINTETQELQGGNFISKLFCGVANWFGHIMSDVAGSSGASGRGSGITIPFYELLLLCDFGSFKVGDDRNTLATVATKVFENGYDARFGLTMAIPVVMCELSIKLIWAIKHFYYHKRPLAECIPNNRHDDLRIMLIVGNGTLCIMDGADAAIRSGGNWVNFFLRLNIIAWFRFVMLVIKEVFIRLGIVPSLQSQIDAYIRINAALKTYLDELKSIDIQRFNEETQNYNRMMKLLEEIDDESKLNDVLVQQYEDLGIALPYKGSFEDFMNDESATLEFK